MKQLVALLYLASFTVNAGIFQGQSSGIFTNPTGSTEMITSGIDTNQFSWGTPAFSANPPSSLEYIGTTFDVNENDEFILGNLNTFNGSILPGTEATAVDISFILNFTSPSAISETFTFNLNLDNTSNSSSNSDDNVNFVNNVPAQYFSFAGADYTLEFLRFDNITGSGLINDNSLKTLEGGTASADILGRITSAPAAVPIPAALWLFGSGLLGLLGSGHFRKA